MRVYDNGIYRDATAEEIEAYNQQDEAPAPEPTAEERISELEKQNAEMAKQNEALLECLLEMSEIVYA